MSPDGSFPHNGSSDWNPIRQWPTMLSLSVREITSVSATFILSSNLDETDPFLASLGLEAAAEGDSDDLEQPEQENISSHSSTAGALKKRPSVIADALAKGLSVKVNGSAWPRAFIRIDDQLDEAVIIIYALMPERQYDIELGLEYAGQTLRRQVTTEDDSDNDTTEITTDPDSPSVDTHSASASSSSDPQSTPSTSPSRTAPGTPPTATNAVPQITLEDRLSQLQQTLSMVNAERETLLTSLKTARRDAQKADSAIRSEIETLKRTSEKTTAAESRGKQKVLALQEAVKRAQNLSRETEELTKEVESEIPESMAKKEKKEGEHKRIQSEADKVHKQREDIEEKDRKRVEAMKTELTGLTNKLERLNGKRDKMETSVIPDLERKMEETEREIQDAEEELAHLEKEERTRIQLEETYLPLQRIRHNSAGPIGRPSQAPIQRPGDPLWNHSQTNSHQTHTPRSQSLHTHVPAKHTHTPVVLLNPQRHSSLKASSSAATSSSNFSSFSTSTSETLSSLQSASLSSDAVTTPSSSSPSPKRTSPGAGAMSTLSSRAPAFEPSRPIGLKVAVGNGNGSHAGHMHSGFSTAIANSTVHAPVGVGRPTRTSFGSNSQSNGYGQRGGHHGHGHRHGQ